MLKRAISRFTLALLTLGVLSVSKPTAAQGVFNMGMLTNTLSQGAIVKSERERARRLGKTATGKRRVRRISSTTWAFPVSAAARKRNIDKFLSTTRATDPALGASFQKIFSTHDVFGLAARDVKRNGLSINNLADTISIYLVAAWYGTRGSDRNPSRAQLLAVRNQMSNAMGGVPDLVRASNTTKQQMSDALVFQTLLVDAYVRGAKKQPKLMPGVKKAIAQGASTSFGLDLNSLRLTSQGLR